MAAAAKVEVVEVGVTVEGVKVGVVMEPGETAAVVKVAVEMAEVVTEAAGSEGR